LDIGCNEGAVGQVLKEKYDCTCVGLDVNLDALDIAQDRLDETYQVDLNATDELIDVIEGRRFDTVIAGDVLEHTIDPWRIVDVLYHHLTESGSILISVPNVGRWELLVSLCRQSWPRRKRGVHDETHLRFFMRNDLADLAPDAATVRLARRNYRLRERARGRLDDMVFPFLSRIPWFREYFVFQYIVEISK
jgi:2-polyprenyl-3-methyl-5-hydroxy-6-metoxy-1,4-benzoquinol methylase